MSHTDWRTRLGFIPGALIGLTLLIAGCGRPADSTPKTADAKTAENGATDAPAHHRPSSDRPTTELAMAGEAVATDAPPNDIPVPNGPPAQLMAFIQDLQTREPQSSNPDAMRAERAARVKAITGAADKVLATPNLDEPTRVAAVKAKIDALVQNLDDPEGLAAVRKYVNVVAKDKDPQLAAMGQGLLAELREVAIQMGDDGEAPAVLADIKAKLSGQQVEMRNLFAAVRGAGTLEMADPPDLAIQAYAAIVKSLEKVDPAMLARPDAKGAIDEIREMADSATRRLGQIGKPLEIEGPLFDGKPLDWSKYRGKVVLVDFWATWCGPCLRELPNVKENFARFHDKGFDVIGVSLDESHDAVAEFFKQEQLPWPTIFYDDPKDQGWMNPLVRKFDINAIPATFLVDREGKLISMSARGPRLTAQLQKLLGRPK